MLKITTTKKRQVIDITDKVEEVLPLSACMVNIFVTHTTAAITTADLDPGTDEDLLDALDNLIPEQKWRHPHNPEHAPDHLLASIIGPGVTVPRGSHKLTLGTWQRIILVELDGPRERQVEVNVIETKQ
jgi:secondary thiamine-phosphate synthase enzyme